MTWREARAARVDRTPYESWAASSYVPYWSQRLSASVVVSDARRCLRRLPAHRVLLPITRWLKDSWPRAHGAPRGRRSIVRTASVLRGTSGACVGVQGRPVWVSRLGGAEEGSRDRAL